MQIFLSDIEKDPLLLSRVRGARPVCCECGDVIPVSDEAKQSAPDGAVCEDCCYSLIGEAIERSPIASAGFRRG